MLVLNLCIYYDFRLQVMSSVTKAADKPRTCEHEPLSSCQPDPDPDSYKGSDAETDTEPGLEFSIQV